MSPNTPSSGFEPVEPGQTAAIEMTVNGQRCSIDVEPRSTLAEVLRTSLGLTGTHLGCEHGVCGACTVIVDGAPVRSCLMLGVQAHGTQVLTIEGLAPAPGEMHPIQRAFSDKLGFQCAFCAPGFLMTTWALLESNPEPTRAEITEALSGNLCRCTGYRSIIDSVEHAVQITTGRAAGSGAAPSQETDSHA